jgi:hypothetical protein
MHSTKTKESRSLEKTLPVTVKSSVQRSAKSSAQRTAFRRDLLFGGQPERAAQAGTGHYVLL